MLYETVNALFENEEFVKRFIAIEDFADMKALFSSFGVDMSDDELKSFLTAAAAYAEKPTGELNESEMEQVAGGFVEWVIIGVTAGIIGGISAYRLRKLLNTYMGTCNKR